MAEEILSSVWVRIGQVIAGAILSVAGVRQYIRGKTEGDRAAIARLESEVKWLRRNVAQQAAELREHRAASEVAERERDSQASAHQARLSEIETDVRESYRRMELKMERFEDLLIRISGRLEARGT
jgi:biopolymer transport protein ExbB/TolQ